MFHFPMEQRVGIRFAAPPLPPRPASQTCCQRTKGRQQQGLHAAKTMDSNGHLLDNHYCAVVFNSAASGFSFLLENNLCIPL